MVIIFLCISLLINSWGIQAKEMDEITKLVIPCGGYGTRMLPCSKSIPKEMLPIMDVPAIQLMAREAVASGIQQCYVITKRQKEAIADHFDITPELENELAKHNKLHFLRELIDIRNSLEFVYIRQPYMGGTGHATALLKNFISDEYFCLGWPDIVILGEDNLFGNMIALAKRERATVIAVTEVPIQEVQNCGVVVVGKELLPGVYEVTDLVEKPKPEKSPSNLINTGRFVLSSKIFSSLDTIPKAANGELQLPDAIADMMNKGERVVAYKIKGKFYDIGRPMSWLETVIRYGLQDPRYKDDIKKMIKDIRL